MEIFAQKDAVNGERVTLVGAVVIRTVVFVALVSGKHNIKLVVHKYIYYFPPLPTLLVSRVCLGINVFQIKIERKGKKKVASVSTIMAGIVARRYLLLHPRNKTVSILCAVTL